MHPGCCNPYNEDLRAGGDTPPGGAAGPNGAAARRAAWLRCPTLHTHPAAGLLELGPS